MKHVLLLLTALLPAASAHAQLGLNAAVLGGGNLGSFSTKYKTYYHAGVFYEATLVGAVSVQPELLYSLQGSSCKDAAGNYEAKLHYLTLPVLAQVTVGPVFVEAGPQVGFLLRKDASGDLSLGAGAGLKLGNLLLGGRFNAGVNDINDVKNLGGTNDPRLRNRVMQAYAALQFGK